MRISSLMISLLAVLLSAALLVAPRTPLAHAQIADDKLIVPGERVGLQRLAARLTDIEAVHGKGTRRGLALWGGSSHYDWRALGLAVMADDTTGNLLLIWIANGESSAWRDYATADGLKLGSAEEQILMAMGPPTRKVEGAGIRSLYFLPQGIIYRLMPSSTETGHVVRVEIMWKISAPGDLRIVPGQRVSAVPLGMPAQQALSMLGGGFIQAQEPPDVLHYHWPHYGFFITIRAGRVVQIQTGWDEWLEDAGIRYSTLEGIGFNSVREHVQGIFGEPEERTTRGIVEWWGYPSRGVAVGFGLRPPKAGVVVNLAVFNRR